MDEFNKALQKCYMREFILRKRLAILLSASSVICAIIALVARHEPMNGIVVMSGSYCFFILLPFPKGWEDRVRRNARKPFWATAKCIVALIAFTLNEFIFKWAPMSCFALLLVIFASAIAPYLADIKKE